MNQPCAPPVCVRVLHLHTCTGHNHVIQDRLFCVDYSATLRGFKGKDFFLNKKNNLQPEFKGGGGERENPSGVFTSLTVLPGLHGTSVGQVLACTAPGLH